MVGFCLAFRFRRSLLCAQVWYVRHVHSHSLSVVFNGRRRARLRNSDTASMLKWIIIIMTPRNDERGSGVVSGMATTPMMAICRKADFVFAPRIQLSCCRLPFSRRFWFCSLLRYNKSIEIILSAVVLCRIFIYFFTFRKIQKFSAVEWEWSVLFLPRMPLNTVSQSCAFDSESKLISSNCWLLYLAAFEQLNWNAFHRWLATR